MMGVMPGGEGGAVDCTFSDIFHLQGWQLAAQSSCTGSFKVICQPLNLLRAQISALCLRMIISTEAVLPSLSPPPWFIPWHLAHPMKLGCLCDETNCKCNYPVVICQRNRYTGWKKQDYKWSKIHLNNGIHLLFDYWPEMQTAFCFPSF